MARLRRASGLLLRILISGGILAWLARRIDWAELGSRLHAAQPGWLVLGALSLGIMLLIGARRWQILLRAHSIDPGFYHLFQVTMIGQFFNAFLLGTTGGDVVKILYIVQAAPQKKSAAGISVIVDRVIGLVALVLITVALTALNYRFLTHTPTAAGTLATFYVIAAGIAGVLVVAAFLPWLMHFTQFATWERRVPFHDQIERFSETLRVQSRARRANGGALGISFFAHAASLFTQYAVALSLGIDLSFSVIAAITGIIAVLISIPVSVAGLGVRESLFVLFLGLGGVSSEAAIAVSLIGFALTLVWSLVGGLFYLRYRHPLHLEQVSA